MAAASINARVQKHRDALRTAGLRPVQIWVPDTRRPDFAAECRRQSQIASQADMADTDMDMDMEHFMDATLADLDGWTE
ncbi:MAG TPA: antitoxin MazE family protein [Aestuariivirga sp.]|nr:antitoxin MazE family protein [Aestuariivirga sp.]